MLVKAKWESQERWRIVVPVDKRQSCVFTVASFGEVWMCG